MQNIVEVTSMNKVKLNIWDREFDIEVVYDKYSDETVLTAQEKALEDFMRATEEIESSLTVVKEYCLYNNREEIGSDYIDNIFKYVMPKYLYVARDNANHKVAIMCNYRYDEENGIAIVFKNEKFLQIGKQDIIL